MSWLPQQDNSDMRIIAEVSIDSGSVDIICRRPPRELVFVPGGDICASMIKFGLINHKCEGLKGIHTCESYVFP